MMTRKEAVLRIQEILVDDAKLGEFVAEQVGSGEDTIKEQSALIKELTLEAIKSF